ncbi:MAG: UDP-N-acetylmuramoyl-tripeptide--D-alanyl-D-alanine ligase [Lachnospiraceae bacterium]|nr:UDP-N-acetylmuramoyl-tripeptide--D-alanyl-D-alanine ligase [Lachnospiraceae bacterium]
METICLQTLAAWCGGTLRGDPGYEVRELVRDSREAGPGCLFVAIKGERLDGHDFANDVLAKGAAVLSSKPARELCPGGVPEGASLILVEDTVKALGAIGRCYKQSMPPELMTVGITGSVGKTSCKDMIAAALSGGRKTLKTLGNFNNHIGVPLTLLRLDHEVQAAVIEMGMNHFGEIDYAASLACPDMGVITNVGTAHIEMLGSREGIRRAKLEMVPHLTRGPLLINGDDDMLMAVKDSLEVPVETFGFGTHNDGVIRLAEPTPEAGMHMVMTYRGETYDLVVNTLGRHMAYNVIPAIMTAVHFGLSREEILRGLASYEATPHRLQRIPLERYLVIDDTYNANPVSMCAAVDALTWIPGEARRVAILGDMFELGDYTREGHLSVGHHLAETEGVHVILTVGQAAAAIEEGYREKGGKQPCFHFDTKEDMLKKILSIVHENDIILLKASHGMQFSDIPERLSSLCKNA